jgi:hypothetical protein
MPVILSTQEAEIKRIEFQSQPEKKARPYLKNTQHKRKNEGMPEVVECPSMRLRVQIPLPPEKQKRPYQVIDL